VKNIFAGVAFAFVVPKVPFNFWFIASAFFVAFVVCMALLVALRLAQRNAELGLELMETQAQLRASEERRRIVGQRRSGTRRTATRKASMRRGTA